MAITASLVASCTAAEIEQPAMLDEVPGELSETQNFHLRDAGGDRDPGSAVDGGRGVRCMWQCGCTRGPILLRGQTCEACQEIAEGINAVNGCGDDQTADPICTAVVAGARCTIRCMDTAVSSGTAVDCTWCRRVADVSCRQKSCPFLRPARKNVQKFICGE